MINSNNKSKVINVSLVNEIAARRNLCDNEPKKLLEDRKKFFSWVMVEHGATIGFNEMYRIGNETTKTKIDNDQWFNKYFNTREKFPTEFNFEIDSLGHKEAAAVICEVCLSLMRHGFHFCVFYAEGSRSPHIRIYNFTRKIDKDLTDLTDFQKERAEVIFWKTVSPMLWKYGDPGVWSSKHPLQLEFALHWKWGTPFNLLFEYLPKLKNKSQTKLFKNKKWIS